MMEKFYTQYQFSRYKTARPANPRQVFGALKLALDIYTVSDNINVKGLDTHRVQKDTQKHNVYLPKFVNVLKNSPITFSCSTTSSFLLTN